MRRTLLAVATLFLLPTGAALTPYAKVVQSGDDDVKTNLDSVLVRVSFVDANGNAQPDRVGPDEAFYLDVDGSGAVTFGDVRLTHFFRYEPGSSVDYANRDFGRSLTEKGWFARDANGAWFVDVDGDDTVSSGDVRITGDGAGTKVAPGDDDRGAILEPVQGTVTPAQRVGWIDANGNLRRDVDESFYLDLNMDGQVTAGELRLTSSGLAPDDEATLRDLRASEDGIRGGLDELAGKVNGWTTTLVVLGLLNLVGLAWLGWIVHRIRNPATGTRGAGPAAGGA